MNTKFCGAVLVSTLLGLCSCASDGSSFVDESSPGTDAATSADTAETLPLREQIAIIEQRLEATNTHDWDRWEALHTPGALRTAPELDTPLRGPAALRAALRRCRWLSRTITSSSSKHLVGASGWRCGCTRPGR